MIIPIGHEHTTVRRLPWVTFVVMALCLVAFVSTQGASDALQQQLGERLQGIFSYFLQHPYLKLDQRLQKLIFPNPRVAQESLEELRQTGPRAPESDAVQEEEQDRLDRLVAEFFDTFADIPQRRYGLVPADTTLHGTVTYMFMHGGWWHLLGNLFLLYLAGPFIEDRWGRPLYTAFYLGAGVVSGMMFALRYPTFEGPLIGASGAIAGVMGAFLVRYWNTKIRFFYWFFFIFMGTFSAPAWLMLPLWFARELLFAGAMDVVAPQGGGGVAYWAHVWGFAFGVGFAFLMRRLQVEERFVHRAIEAKITVVDNPVVEQAMQSAGEGRPDEALRLLTDELKARPDNDDAVVALWSLALRQGQPAVAAPYVLALVRRAVRRGELVTFRSLWRELLDQSPATPVDPAVSLRVSELLAAEHDGLDEAREALEVADRWVDAGSPAGLLVRLARQADALDSPAAASLISRALEHQELPAEARVELEGLAERRRERAPEADEKEAVELVAAEDIDLLEPEPDALPRSLRVVEVVPLALGEASLKVLISGEARTVSYDALKAVSVAGIKATPPFVVVDLMLDAPWGGADELRTMRVLSHRFDPRKLVGGTDVKAGYRQFLSDLLRISGLVPLPDEDRALGRPFAVYDRLDSYEEKLLARG
jgi:membrane associated rhomboid family serine protease